MMYKDTEIILKNNQKENSDYIHQWFISLVFFMTTWKSNRTDINTQWNTKKSESNTKWNHNRIESPIKWWHDRKQHWVYSRDYVLWSFFTKLLHAISDPRDWFLLKIKTDYDYEVYAEYNSRVEKDTQWKSRI